LEEKEQNTATAKHNAVKAKHTATQAAALVTAPKATAPSSGGGGYMGQIADARARLAQATAEEEWVHVKLDMSKCELGGLEMRCKAVEREAGQSERNTKKMEAEVESLRKKADVTGWVEKRSMRVRKCCTEKRTVRCAAHRYVFPLSFKRRLLFNNFLAA
jgi:structural maintenance of chromosome 2